MGLRHGAPNGFDLLYLVIQEPSRPLDHLVLWTRVSRYWSYLRSDGEWRKPDVDDVQLRVGAVGQVDGRKEGQLGLLGTVGGQKDLRWEDAHLLLLLCTLANPTLQGLSSTPSRPKCLTRVMLTQTAVEEEAVPNSLLLLFFTHYQDRTMRAADDTVGNA